MWMISHIWVKSSLKKQLKPRFLDKVWGQPHSSLLAHGGHCPGALCNIAPKWSSSFCLNTRPPKFPKIFILFLVFRSLCGGWGVCVCWGGGVWDKVMTLFPQTPEFWNHNYVLPTMPALSQACWWLGMEDRSQTGSSMSLIPLLLVNNNLISQIFMKASTNSNAFAFRSNISSRIYTNSEG